MTNTEFHEGAEQQKMTPPPSVSGGALKMPPNGTWQPLMPAMNEGKNLLQGKTISYSIYDTGNSIWF